MAELRSPNVNCLWGDMVAGTLAHLGVRHAVIAPGSRSAPLVWGLTRQKDIQAISVLDERSAAFYALGLARASGQPVALVCTSGTAAANFYPAIIEASLGAVPLLVMTADRPPELRDCGAGQAIDQVKLYGNYPRWQHELALPEADPAMLHYLRQTLIQAWSRAQSPRPGPVHLNFPFREPLAPIQQTDFFGPVKEVVDFMVTYFDEHKIEIAAESTALFNNATAVLKAKSGVIIAGPAQPANRAQYLKQATAWAKRRGWPILADALSPLRHAPKLSGQLIAHYDLILRAEDPEDKLAPEAVIHLGPLPTSKRLRSWLDKLSVPVLIIHDGPDNVDPLHRPASYWRGSLSIMKKLDAKPPAADKMFLKRWLKLETEVEAALSKELKATDWLFEGKAAWLLSQHLPKGTPVFAASSMPVRDCEFFWQAGHAQQLFFNRGANGIDGTLSTALGVAHATGKPTVLYTGDLALLHDQNGLLAARELPPGASLTIVLINNDGGGIFEHLPIAKFDPPFERFFATPQKVDFKKLAEMHGLEYVCPATWPEFEQTLLPPPKQGVRIIELRTDRKRDAAFRAKIFKEISQNL